MVWGFFAVDPPSGENYNFFNKGSYEVGRKEIIIEEMVPSDQSSTFLSKVHLRDKNSGSRKKVPSIDTMLKDGDIISLETGDATYRFSYVPFTLLICSPRTQQITQMVSSIGASVTTTWSWDITHVLVDDSCTLSDDLILAILSKKTIVQYSWVELIAEKNICTDIPTPRHAPNLMLEGVLMKVGDPHCRDFCLKGYSFLLKPEFKYKFDGRLQSLLEVSGANVSSNEMVHAQAKDGEDHVITVVPAGSSSIPLPWVSEIDIVSVVLMGYLDPSIIRSPLGTDFYARMIRVQTNTFGSGVRVDIKDLPNMKDLPDSDPTDFSCMPVDCFGEAYLKAYGHDREKGKIFQSAAGLPKGMGLGYKPPKENTDSFPSP